MSDVPPVDYALSDGHELAYQVFGAGPPELLFLRGPINHLDLQWEEPRFARFLRGLGSFARVVTYDMRGFGLSERTSSSQSLPLELWADDAVAVLDATECERVGIVAVGGAARRAIVFAATHPERVSGLALCNATVTTNTWKPLLASESSPAAATISAEDDAQAVASHLRSHFGRVAGRTDFHPGWSERFCSWVARYERSSATPQAAAAFASRAPTTGNVGHILSTVHVPVLALATEANVEFVSQARLIAESIEGAELRVLPGQAHINGWLFDDPEAVTDEIARFLVGRPPTQRSDRVLASVLFTDIVESTRTASDMGDARWRHVLDQLDDAVESEVRRFSGRLVKHTGDGHLATFDLPGRAIACAKSLLELARTNHGLRLRAGIHTGEVELRGEDVAGMAVIIGSRICDLAGPESILVSAAVPALVAGSQLSFTDTGSHNLKGVSEPWRVYEVNA